jgi:hypothetical protein
MSKKVNLEKIIVQSIDYKSMSIFYKNSHLSSIRYKKVPIDQEDIELFADLKVDLKSNETSNIVSNDDDDDDEMYAFLEISDF